MAPEVVAIIRMLNTARNMSGRQLLQGDVGVESGFGFFIGCVTFRFNNAVLRSTAPRWESRPLEWPKLTRPHKRGQAPLIAQHCRLGLEASNT